jgi:hypothetical protein
MISLDDQELAIVMTLAAPLHPHRRSAFLQAVVEEASKHSEIGPGLVSRIGRAVQKTFLIANPVPTHEPGGATRQIERRR